MSCGATGRTTELTKAEEEAAAGVKEVEEAEDKAAEEVEKAAEGVAVGADVGVVGWVEQR